MTKSYSFDFLAALQCGSLSFTPFAIVDGKEMEGASEKESVTRNTVHLSLKKNGVFTDDLFFQFEGSQIRCRRQFKNLTGEILKLNELGFRISGLNFADSARDDFFYHNENPRIYEVLAFPVDYNRTAKDAKDTSFDLQAGNRWADPGVVCERIGRSPYQPFPAILLGNYRTNHGLVHGTLKQNPFYHNYLVYHKENTLKLDIFSSFKDIAWLEVKPGRTLTDEWYLGATDQSHEIEHIFDGYTKVLREILPPMYGATKLNRDNMVWGSWNDGIFRKISEQMILEEAAYLKKNFPTVRWIQVDDGYSSLGNDNPAHGLGVPYEGEAGIDHQKFPNGMRAFTDKVREIGLRPAIWIGGFCPVITKIFKEHPEWFIDYSYRVTTSEPLDVSQKTVREYMTFALDTLLTDYGFEAVKHDFWSYAFEDSHDLYQYHDASGYEWRDWWLKEVRKRIASDGYFQTGCDIVMGNPFLGQFFTNYRYGIDIGGGNWDYVRTNYLWGVACFSTHTGDLFVPNSDSVGLFPGLNETEAMFALNYCLVTHTMVEIAGKLSKNQDSPRIPILKKAVCNPNNGQDIFFGKWDYLDAKQKYPHVIYFKTPHFCPAEEQPGMPLRTVGFFNLEDAEQNISVTPEELGIAPAADYRMKDIWTGEEFEFQGKISFHVPAHGSRVLAVCSSEKGCLMDANIRILRSERKDNTLTFFFDYANDAELIFDSVPAAVILDGKEIKADSRSIHAKIEKNSVMQVIF